MFTDLLILDSFAKIDEIVLFPVPGEPVIIIILPFFIILPPLKYILSPKAYEPMACHNAGLVTAAARAPVVVPPAARAQAAAAA